MMIIVELYWHFKGSCCLHYLLLIEAAGYSETLLCLC